MPWVGDGWLEPESVQRLVRQARDGDPRTLDALLTKLRPFYVRFFARHLPDDAEDLAQLALLRVAGAHARIDLEHAAAYFFTIAANLLRSTRRRAARDRNRAVPVELDDDLPGLDCPDGDVERRDLAAAVQDACAQALPAPLRHIAVGLLEGLTEADVARRDRLSYNTVRTRWRRARALLRERLSPYR